MLVRVPKVRRRWVPVVGRAATMGALACAAFAQGCDTTSSGGPNDARPGSDDDVSFVEEGADTSAAESDAQLLTSSLVAASGSGIGLASLDLTGSELAGRDIGDGARAIYFPRSCLDVVHDPAARVVTYEFRKCIGPLGLRGVEGRVSARYAVTNDDLHLDLVADRLTINGATVDWSATADITSSDTERRMTWKAELSGTSAGGRSFTRTNDHTVQWRIGEPCLEVTGTSEGTIAKRDRAGEDRAIRTEITRFRRCRADCPEAGGTIKITNVSKNRSIELRYDGTNQATFVGPRGETASVRLLCRP